MIVVTRYRAAGEDFAGRAQAALQALGRCSGFRSARVGRAADEARLWVIVIEWESVGAYRRALSSYDVKVSATPLLATAVDEPTAFEIVLALPEGSVSAPDRAADADTAGPGRSR